MATPKFGRTLVYLRVSTTGQTGEDHASLETQTGKATTFIQAGGGRVEYLLTDAQSGKDSGRKEYARIYDLVRAKKVDTVCFYRVDRSMRDVAEWFLLVRFLKAHKVGLVSATQDISNPLVGGMLAVVAQAEAEAISERVRDVLRTRQREGRWINRAPLGYVLVPHPAGGGKTLALDPETWEKVRHLFELYATGNYGLAALVRHARLIGLRNGLTTTALSRMLSNEAYLGGVQVTGHRKRVQDENGRLRVLAQAKEDWDVGPSNHPAIIDQATFDACQVVKARNSQRKAPRPATRQLLVGMIRCKCGARIQGVQNTSGAYYFCPQKRLHKNCDQKMVVAWKLDDQVKDLVEAMLRPALDPLTRPDFDQALANLGDEALDHAQIHARSLAESRRNLEAALDRGRDLVLTGVMPAAVYQAKEQEYQKRLDAVDREIAEVGEVKAAPNVDEFLRVLDLIDDLDSMTKEGWRGLLQTLVNEVAVNDDQVTGIDYLDDVKRTLVQASAKVAALA